MKNSHLISILKTCSRGELKEMRKWLLVTPRHNRPDLVAFLDYLMVGNHLGADKFLEKERVYRKLFPKTAYDDVKMRQLIHFLLKATEDFLVQQELLQHPLQTKLALASIYRRRGLEKPFAKTMRKLRHRLDEHDYRDEKFLRFEYLVQREQYSANEGKRRTVQMNLQETSDALDAAFIADKLRMACHMLSHQAVYKAGYQIGMLGDVLNYVQHKDWLKEPAVSIYYYGYRAMTDQDEPTHFKNLRTAIGEHETKFAMSERREIYLMALNYCIKKMNAGNKAFIREAFELYRSGFDQKILISEDRITRFTFLNATLNALRLKEYGWAETFIEDYQQFLDEQVREGVVNYSKARLYFELDRYDEAQLLLLQADANDLLINLNSKVLLLKIYYENREYDALDSLISSTRAYLRRKEVIVYHKELFKNTLQMIQRLVQVSPYDTKAQQKLKTEIQETNPMSEREWLMEQLNRMG